MSAEHCRWHCMPCDQGQIVAKMQPQRPGSAPDGDEGRVGAAGLRLYRDASDGTWWLRDRHQAGRVLAEGMGDLPTVAEAIAVRRASR